MKDCEIIRDLIPLYVEHLLSDPSTQMVEEHLQECPDCRELAKESAQAVEISLDLPPSGEGALLKKIARYQNGVKLTCVLTAMLLAGIIMGCTVQFLSTIPVLLLVPFFCRLFYKRTLPILAAAAGAGVIGGFLSGNNSYWVFLTALFLLSSGLGLGAAALINAVRQGTAARPVKIVLLGCVALLLGAGSFLHASIWGNPVGWVQTAMKANEYVAGTYEPGTLQFKGVYYSFKSQEHAARYAYLLDGVWRETSVGFFRDGSVDDQYRWALDLQFCEDRSNAFKTAVAAATDYTPMHVSAAADGPLTVDADELDASFTLMGYDRERQVEAYEHRQSESKKLRFLVEFGRSYPETQVTKDQLLVYAKEVQRALEEQGFPYRSVEMRAYSGENGYWQVSFSPETNGQELEQSLRQIEDEKAIDLS